MIHSSITFQVNKKYQRKITAKGNIYIECDTNKGKIAVWGSSSNLVNISKIEKQEEPFQLISDQYVNPSWEQHIYWIPESANIQIK